MYSCLCFLCACIKVCVCLRLRGHGPEFPLDECPRCACTWMRNPQCARVHHPLVSVCDPPCQASVCFWGQLRIALCLCPCVCPCGSPKTQLSMLLCLPVSALSVCPGVWLCVQGLLALCPQLHSLLPEQADTCSLSTGPPPPTWQGQGRTQRQRQT